MAYLPTPFLPALAAYRLPDPFSMPPPVRRPPSPTPLYAPPALPSLPANRAMENAQTSVDHGFDDLRSALEPKKPEPQHDSILDLVKQLHGIVDDWGGVPAATSPQGRGFFAMSRGRPAGRAMTPMEGPDTGDINPNASVPGVPAGYYGALARFESGNRSSIVNPTSGATGEFQFLPSTWASIEREAPWLHLTPEGITDDVQQLRALDYYTGQSVNLLKPLLQRDPTGGELYAMHLLGHAGGQNVLANPTMPLRSLLPDAVFQSNPWLSRYRTGADLVPALNDLMGDKDA